MTYVPIITPTPTQPPSPRTRELAGLLSKVLEEYTKAHPGVSNSEVRAAIRLARMSAAPDSTTVAVKLSLALGLGVLMMTLGVFFFGKTEGFEIGPILPIIIAVGFGLVAVALAVVKSQR
jgi:hypothetical protein